MFFSGYKIGNNYLDTIERQNLKKKTRYWELVNLVSKDNSTLRIEKNCFSVTYFNMEIDKVLLLGGSDKVIKFQFEDEEHKEVRKNLVFVSNRENCTLEEVDNVINSEMFENFTGEKFLMPYNDTSSGLIALTKDLLKFIKIESDNSKNLYEILQCNADHNTSMELPKKIENNNYNDDDNNKKLNKKDIFKGEEKEAEENILFENADGANSNEVISKNNNEVITNNKNKAAIEEIKINEFKNVVRLKIVKDENVADGAIFPILQNELNVSVVSNKLKTGEKSFENENANAIIIKKEEEKKKDSDVKI